MAASNTDILFKFCSAESAKKILSTQSMRWSAPCLLGDPLEPTHETRLDFDGEALLKGVIKVATSMIFAREVPKGNAPLLTAIRRWREEERFASPDEAEVVLKELLSQMVDQRLEIINKIMSDWQDYAQRLRICSFCGKWENLVAWQLFSHNYTGVVLRFQLQDTKSFGDPVPVKYTAERPVITTMKDQLGVILANERYIAQEYFQEKFSTKPSAYSDQQELRCFYHLAEDDPAPGPDCSQWFVDRPFEPDSLKGVYFGMCTGLKDKQEIWDLVKKNFSLVKMYSTKVLPAKFELESERLTEKPS